MSKLANTVWAHFLFPCGPPLPPFCSSLISHSYHFAFHLCPLSLCLSFHTSVYTPSPLVSLCLSLPGGCVQPYMVREQCCSLVGAKEMLRNYQSFALTDHGFKEKCDGSLNAVSPGCLGFFLCYIM